MAEPSYMYSLEEMAQALMVKQGIHEGLWAFAIEFSFSASAAGPTLDEMLPCGIVGVSKIGLNKSKVEAPLTFDAAILNPEKKTVMKKVKKPVTPKIPLSKKPD